MSDYRYHLNHKFGSCRHIANARDEARGRDVRLYHIPGNFEVVGIFDGIDCWISPITIDPFSAGIARIYADIRAGKSVGVSELPQPRQRVKLVPQMELPFSSPRPRVRVQAPIPEAQTVRSRNRV